MEKSDSAVIVIFGASGDLAKRKLMPALFQLMQDSLFPNSRVLWDLPGERNLMRNFVLK